MNICHVRVGGRSVMTGCLGDVMTGCVQDL